MKEINNLKIFEYNNIFENNNKLERKNMYEDRLNFKLLKRKTDIYSKLFKFRNINS